MPRSSVATSAVAAMLLLTACSSDGDDSADAAAHGGGGAPSGADACRGLTDAGLTGADFGPVATFESPGAVQQRVELLSAMSDVTAPAELEQAWQVRLGYVERLSSLVADAGGGAIDPAAAQPTAEEAAASEELTDWYFATCG